MVGLGPPFNNNKIIKTHKYGKLFNQQWVCIRM